ncbi:MAG: hypothetical protein O3A63_07695 [Proteobacteria bacterium]|nr:hypothetical protein [Pseudomonadota bacterium]
MGSGYHISPDEGLISIRLEGDVSLEALQTTLSTLITDTHYLGNLPQLIDCRGFVGPMGTELVGFMKFISSEFRPAALASVAVVIDPDLDATRTAGMIRLTSALKHAELFDDYNHALKWLIHKEFRSSSANAATKSQP